MNAREYQRVAKYEQRKQGTFYTLYGYKLLHAIDNAATGCVPSRRHVGGQPSVFESRAYCAWHGDMGARDERQELAFLKATVSKLRYAFTWHHICGVAEHLKYNSTTACPAPSVFA